jgi:hypothetical protein
MVGLTFTDLIDRTRLDRLQADILAFAEKFRERGFNDLEIARELLAASFERAAREPRNYITESFYHHVCQTTARLLSRMSISTDHGDNRPSVTGNEEMTPDIRFDWLQGEILAFVSDYHELDYNNMEVARELFASAVRLAEGEPPRELTLSFYQHILRTTEQLLADMGGLLREMAAEYEQRQIN